MPPSRAPVMLAKASLHKCQEFQLLQCYKCQTKACQLLQFASAKKLTKLLPILKCHTKAWKLLQFTSARKTCTHNCLQTASTHRCRIKACKLLQFPLARKTREMLSTHHLLANCLKSLSARNCKLLQFFRFPPMLCCVVLCCAMLCCVILCYTTPHCKLLYYAISWHSVL